MSLDVYFRSYSLDRHLSGLNYDKVGKNMPFFDDFKEHLANIEHIRLPKRYRYMM